MNIPQHLPCFPCPHRSVCCRWGTALSQAEYWTLFSEFGGEYVYFNEDDNEYRTQVKDGRCVFFDRELGGCGLHDHSHYPRMCKDFPHKDTRDALLPHAFDATMCPEVTP